MTLEQTIVFIVAPLLGYLLGSVPFALLIGKSHGVDIRTVGSKNIGATNLGRTLGKKYFWQAFLLDAAKGFVPVLLVALYVRNWNADPLATLAIGWSPLPSWSPLLTAIACVLGHNFPLWLKFKGGKGVATSFGVVLGFWPLYTLAAIGAGFVFVVVLMIYRYISLGSIVGVLSFVALVFGIGQWMRMEPRELNPLLAIAALFAALIIYRHKANIARLLKGTEPQVGQKERDKANMK
jgi:glycerol-3-phosphate acyltransferase PlsY